MSTTTTYNQFLVRSRMIDTKYLQKIDDFLRGNFSRLLYSIETNSRSAYKMTYDELFELFDKIGDEKIKNITVYAYKNNQTDLFTEDLYLRFEKHLFWNVNYSYRDCHDDVDDGFINRFEKALMGDRFWYAFIFDDDIVPSQVKSSFLLFLKICLAAYLGYWYYLSSISETFLIDFLYILVFVIALTWINEIFDYFFPKIVFVIREKETRPYARYIWVLSKIKWLIGGLFFIILGMVLEKIRRTN